MDQQEFSARHPYSRNAYLDYGIAIDDEEEENELLRRLEGMGNMEAGDEDDQEHEEVLESIHTNKHTKRSQKAFLTQSDDREENQRPFLRNPRLVRFKTRKLDPDSRPEWTESSTGMAAPTPDLYVTDINQTHDAIRARDMRAAFNEGQTSADWLKTHSVEIFKLTLKDLLVKGAVTK
ncbi:uncharacterized protein LOC117114691 [Anneissia japonica]|uniref:uncharacterized protein LOC117114691 n=1 Tax=Anneissia japonica TaxID=1529436 RepID=UPI001425AA44|nr:uncharacterized protein LOC117114691 [Anneissia japonica]